MIVPSKFQFPAVPEWYVKRPRLEMKLQGVFKRRLTLVVGPPGSGKTMLVGGWKEKVVSSPIAYLSLEEADNHLLRFWLLIIAAIEQASPGFDNGVTNRFIEQFMQQPKRALADFADACSQLPTPVALVLDDYHVIDIPDIHDMLSEWIRNMPAQVHVIVISRTEAPLQLPKSMQYRVGWNDLAFKSGEARKFYRKALPIQVSDEEVRRWQEQTEGWALGMQMLSAARQHELKGVKRDDRYRDESMGIADSQGQICERLLAHLLSKQASATIDFLLRTSIPARMNKSLCSALTGLSETDEMLEALGKEHIFFQRLHDGAEAWYRYHPLIAQMLQDMLQRQDKPLWHSLQLVTARWLESNGYPMEAMEHYVKGAHYEEAGRLLEQLFKQFIMQEAWTLMRFFAMIPEETIQSRPKLYLSFLFFAAGRQEPDHTLAQLDAIERRVIADRGERSAEESAYYMRVIAVMRAYVSIIKRDLEGVVRYLCDYADLGYPDDEIFAYIDYAAQHSSRLKSFPGVTGHLRKAQLCFEPIVLRWRSIRSYNTAYYAIGYAELLYEWNLLNDAELYATLARSIGDEQRKAALYVPAAIMQSRLAYARNEYRQAQRYLREARAGLDDKETQHWAPILEACETKLHLLSPEGDPGAAARYVEVYACPVSQESDGNDLMCALVYARALIAQGRYAEARAKLKQIEKLAKERDLLAEQLEICILQAVKLQKQDKLSLAARSFGRALQLSAGDGHVRIYVDEGESFREIVEHYRKLRQAYKVKERQVSIRYVNQLLFAFEAQASMPNLGTDPAAAGNNPLSAMEKQVLLGASKSYTSKEIAASLGVSTGTVHTYMQRIFAKLQVNKRKDAVLKAFRAGWLESE